MKTRKTQLFAAVFCCLLFGLNGFAQSGNADSIKTVTAKIFAYCLDANVSPALEILSHFDSAKLSDKELAFKTELEKRFAGKDDKSDFLVTHGSRITDLLTIYRDYWRISLLDNSKSYDSVLVKDLSLFFSSKYSLQSYDTTRLPDDTLDVYMKKYISSFGYFTTGFGRTGKLLDLLVWKSQKDTVYTFSVNKEKIRTPVVFMDDFITVGWEEYATLGLAYPGGWATTNALFCVRKAYDLKSEDFLIRYLCHEGRHFMDYKLFPKLTSPDLEYRAKLTELSLLNTELYQIINEFINEANYESENGHSVADFCVIRDLSKALFHVDFERDMNTWKSVSADKIHKSAVELLAVNTKALKKEGKGVEKYIKK